MTRRRTEQPRPASAPTRHEIDIEEMARALAIAHNLVTAEGTMVCWECREQYALLPSLHCGKCLGAAYQRLHIVEPWCQQREQVIPEEAVNAE